MRAVVVNTLVSQVKSDKRTLKFAELISKILRKRQHQK